MPHNWWTQRASHEVVAEAGPLVIAHRGDRAHAPENTIVAFERALAAGSDAFELDVHVIVDGTVVVCHDATLDRTTDATGPIAHTTFAELRDADAGAHWSPHPDPDKANTALRGGPRPFAGRGIRVPTLGEVLEAFPATPMIIDAKSVPTGLALIEVIERHGARDRVLIGSFLLDALRPARGAGYCTTAAQAELVPLLPHALFRRRAPHVPFDAAALPPRHRGFPVPVLGFARATARPVFVWTVNDPALAATIAGRGADMIVTDNPVMVREVLAKLYEVHRSEPDRHVAVSNELRDQLARTLSEDQTRTHH